jgi:HPt (histidine-containing phosphotransfer) domain-containing protein
MDHDETTELHGMPLSASPQLAPEDSGPDLDISAFDNLVEEIGRDGTLQTFSLFFQETTDRFKRMRALSCETDRNAIRQDAHGLKGTAANFGFRQVSELAAKLEKDAPSIAPANYAAALQSLEINYAAAREQFAKLIA